MDKVNELLNWFDELSLRERGFVSLGIIFLMFMIWYGAFIEPLELEEKRLIQDLEQKRTELIALSDSFSSLSRLQTVDPDSDSKKKHEKLSEQIRIIEEEINQSTAHLITPDKMAEVLRLILNQSEGLTFVKLQGLGKSPLLNRESKKENADPAEPEADTGLGAAYKHGVMIEFEGSFFEILNYMRRLENLEWGFFWDSINFRVEEYPKSRSTLTMYTLSLNPNWIGA